MLDDLQYHCETLASEYLTKENVIENFKKAKVGILSFDSEMSLL